MDSRPEPSHSTLKPSPTINRLQKRLLPLLSLAGLPPILLHRLRDQADDTLAEEGGVGAVEPEVVRVLLAYEGIRGGGGVLGEEEGDDRLGGEVGDCQEGRRRAGEGAVSS